MKRLFVTLRVDPMASGTLLEISTDKCVDEIKNQIIVNMDLPKEINDKPVQYRLIRLGSPNILLQPTQKFCDTEVKNGDLLFLYAGEKPLKGSEFFAFEPLQSISHKLSVQELRESVYLNTYNITFEQAVEDQELKTQIRSDCDSGNPEQTIKIKRPTFEFEPLDLPTNIEFDTSEENSESETKGTTDTGNLSKKWKKIDTSGL